MLDLLCKLYGKADVFLRLSKIAKVFVGESEVPARCRFSGPITKPLRYR
ncbi:hypothetical protein VU07_05100 [Desulfobulbus sp. F4]|nr:hypothetical protein [Desulfobulbus sp. F4]